MKRKNLASLFSAICVLPLFAAGSVSAATLLEYWDFESDSAGDGLVNISNSGSLGSTWNFNTTTQNDESDGAGLFVLSGDSGNFTRKLPKAGTTNANAGTDFYASPFTTGTYLVEISFDSWSADAASVGDTWKLGINDSAGNAIAQLIWDVDSTSSTRLRASTTTAGGSAFRTLGSFGLSNSTATTVGVEFDFDNDTVRYLLNGAEQYLFTDFNGTDIGQMLYVKNGDGTSDWATSATSVSIDSMGLSAIPEPTAALLGGLGFLALLRRRR
ncbi:MAG: hypothetical protein H7A50_16125 [Akkermansiaceae bacterium]|nr:hypothetical protein [Akkermansiaceae bacterium]